MRTADVRERINDFLDFAKDFIFCILPIVLFIGGVITALTLFILWMCMSPDVPSAVKAKQRISQTSCGMNLEIVHDSQTGKEYLVNHHGGLVEIESTKPESKVTVYGDEGPQR